jgi:hypothetical protein
MSNNLPHIPLSIQNDIEQTQSWEGFATPHDFALYCARVLSIDPDKLEFIRGAEASNLPPTDKSKVWIKTDIPYGIGIPVGGTEYKMIYQWPQSTAFLWMGNSNTLPTELRRLSTDELEDLKLEAPNATIASWVVLKI